MCLNVYFSFFQYVDAVGLVLGVDSMSVKQQEAQLLQR